MAKLIYSTIASLDGYSEDENGNFDWAAPDEAVHTFINELERPVGTYLFGRRMYETMLFWETAHEIADLPRHIADFAAIWQTADKIVYSTTLDAVTSANTRISREFDAGAVRRLKASAERDIAIGGPVLAAEALRAGLVDELQLFVVPYIAGDGKRALPDGVRAELELLDKRGFANGTVYARYRVLEP